MSSSIVFVHYFFSCTNYYSYISIIHTSSCLPDAPIYIYFTVSQSVVHLHCHLQNDRMLTLFYLFLNRNTKLISSSNSSCSSSSTCYSYIASSVFVVIDSLLFVLLRLCRNVRRPEDHEPEEFWLGGGEGEEEEKEKERRRRRRRRRRRGYIYMILL